MQLKKSLPRHVFQKMAIFGVLFCQFWEIDKKNKGYTQLRVYPFDYYFLSLSIRANASS